MSCSCRSSCTPKRYKRNAINSDLYRAQRISSNFSKEKKVIRDKFLKADYPNNFISNVFREYDSKHSNENPGEDDELIIPTFLFQEPKQFIMFEIPYCSENELVAKLFLRSQISMENNNGCTQ